jgi:hypothetical protein
MADIAELAVARSRSWPASSRARMVDQSVAAAGVDIVVIVRARTRAAESVSVSIS